MRTAIIGAGNMGGSIARGLAKGSIIPASDIIVSNPSQGKLDELQAEFPALQITHDNQEAIIGAEFIILAVKPWLIYRVEEIAQLLAISPRAAYNLCNTTKDFRVLRIGTSIRVNKQSFDSWFAAV